MEGRQEPPAGENSLNCRRLELTRDRPIPESESATRSHQARTRICPASAFSTQTLSQPAVPAPIAPPNSKIKITKLLTNKDMSHKAPKRGIHLNESHRLESIS